MSKLKAWKIIDSGISSAHSHMQKDGELLSALSTHDTPILHFYEWAARSATYGYFIKPEKLLHLDAVKKRGLVLAKRPTGGGIVFHLSDFAFSALLPSSHPKFSLKPLDNYAFINAIVKQAILKFMRQSDVGLLDKESETTVLEASHFCMAKPTKYDILINGLKVSGGAERLTKFGVLHQGTIALGMPPQDILREFLLTDAIFDCMKKNSGWLLKPNYSQEELQNAKTKIKQLLIDAFKFNCV